MTKRPALPELEDLRPGHCLMLASGRQIDPFGEITPDDIHMEDIARGLVNATRWLGQTSRRFSVAEHSMIGARLIDPAFRFEFLMHDAPEAYLPEMPRCLKMRPEFAFYREAEQRIWVAIAAKLNLPEEHSQEVIDCDARMAAAEYDVLVIGRHDCWSSLPFQHSIFRNGEPPTLEQFLSQVYRAFYDFTFGAR